MTTYYAGDVQIEIEEYGTDNRGAPKYRGKIEMESGETWPFKELSGWKGEIGAAEDALSFGAYYTSDNRPDDLDPDYPSAKLADKIAAALVDALTSETLPVGIDKGENTDPKGGQIYVGDCYVVADSPEAFARFIARENAHFYREEAETARAEIRKREAAGESILSPVFPGSPWAEVSRLLREENTAREAAGLGKRREHTAWPGGYPIIYVDACEGRGTCPDNDPGSYLCADCATEHEDKGGKVAPGVHWEGPPEECSACGKVIESAYGDPDAEDRK